MNWNDLPLALAIARAGSLTGAADALDKNHSTVFRRLNALEDDLGVRLFDRLPTGYVPTPVGHELLAQAERAADAVDTLMRQAQGLDQRPSGEVRLTTPPNLATHYVPLALKTLADTHPGIRVVVIVSDAEYDLSRREADLALRATRAPPDHLVGRKVAELQWHVVGAPGYLAQAGVPVTLDTLHEHRFIGAEASFAHLPAFRFLATHVPAQCVVAAANSFNAMAAMARAGLGLAVLPNDQPTVGVERLLTLPLEDKSALWLLTHPDLRHVARIRAVSDALLEAVQAQLH